MLYMSFNLSFREVSYPGFFEHFSCEIPSGSSALIVTARDLESTVLTRLITGLSHPSHGSVLSGDLDLETLGTGQLHQLRQQIAIVPGNGGLISNLKVWENMTLPVLYHMGMVTEEEEKSALDYLTTLGYSGSLMALPAHLSVHEKLCIALVRAFLTRPRVIVYSNCLDGLTSEQSDLFVRLTKDFHAACEDRISLYLTSTADIADELAVDRVMTIHNSGSAF
jgi:phospholipid/cholesterol/gamma-HCH transport system ATP-binding protein